MPLDEEMERSLRALASEIRQRVAVLAGSDEAAAMRRLISVLKAPARAADRERIRGLARTVFEQGGRCATCRVSFADSPPSTQGMIANGVVCSRCAREAKAPAARR